MTERLSLEACVVAGGSQEEGEDAAAGQGEEGLPEVYVDKGCTKGKYFVFSI